MTPVTSFISSVIYSVFFNPLNMNTFKSVQNFNITFGSPHDLDLLKKISVRVFLQFLQVYRYMTTVLTFLEVCHGIFLM